MFIKLFYIHSQSKFLFLQFVLGTPRTNSSSISDFIIIYLATRLIGPLNLAIKPTARFTRFHSARFTRLVFSKLRFNTKSQQTRGDRKTQKETFVISRENGNFQTALWYWKCYVSGVQFDENETQHSKEASTKNCPLHQHRNPAS